VGSYGSVPRLVEEIEMSENLFEAVLMIALVVITLLFLKFAL
jgi:hypothetical protein